MTPRYTGAAFLCLTALSACTGQLIYFWREHV